MKRIWPKRKGGIINKDAAYWQGERAEDIVKKRVAGYKKRRPSKRRKHRGRNT